MERRWPTVMGFRARGMDVSFLRRWWSVVQREGGGERRQLRAVGGCFGALSNGGYDRLRLKTQDCAHRGENETGRLAGLQRRGAGRDCLTDLRLDADHPLSHARVNRLLDEGAQEDHGPIAQLRDRGLEYDPGARRLERERGQRREGRSDWGLGILFLGSRRCERSGRGPERERDARDPLA